MSITERLNKLSTTQALVVGIVFGILYFSFWYQDGSRWMNQIKDAKEQIQVKKKELAALKRKIQRGEEFKATVGVLGEQFRSLLKYIPEELRTADLMKTLSEEAKAAGTNINGMSQARSRGQSEDQFYEKVSVRVELEGNYKQLLLFLSNLTKLDHILTVEELNMQSSRGRASSEGSPTVSFSAVVSGYRYAPKDEEEAS